ncbi:DUF2793 domain-containing protein [Roseicyclus persicicus]|uniref:DUF2793 domain-containing protein n=1 Tax=Roseicyclus persicicus TaxID=2650661 RepID=A0A7X6H369_9RHOB|nr:DUF2793 domain-containing protein [Roseibacterium persicicum]NKX46313.1 DUF2793 domain-containing protein [Roseibacterium persicicum]
MTDTPRLSLPLLAPAQAQKHVTVNEALVRVDGMTQLVLASASLTTPPAAAPEGTVYAVPPGGVNAWAGQDGRLALSVNGGWVFVAPQRGWRAFVLDSGLPAVWDGADWRPGAVSLSPAGASMSLSSLDIEVVLSAGPAVTTAPVIPARALLFGVTGRVTEAITGTAASWDLGVPGDTGRFGTGLGTGLNSWVNGPAAPIVYWTPTALEITAQGGSFAGGALTLVLHYAELRLPDPV